MYLLLINIVCQSTRPFEKDDFIGTTLTQILRNCPDLQWLYSTKRDKLITPVHEAFILPEEIKANARRQFPGYPAKKKTCHHLLDGTDANGTCR